MEGKPLHVEVSIYLYVVKMIACCMDHVTQMTYVILFKQHHYRRVQYQEHINCQWGHCPPGAPPRWPSSSGSLQWRHSLLIRVHWSRSRSCLFTRIWSKEDPVTVDIVRCWCPGQFMCLMIEIVAFQTVRSWSSFTMLSTRWRCWAIHGNNPR